MIIRQERPEDYDTVYHVVKEAFENAEYTDGNEQNLVAALRKSKSFIPELSLVAVEDEKIVGHILFTKAVVQGVEVLALAPLSVLPDYQNRGIRLSLMKDLLNDKRGIPVVSSLTSVAFCKVLFSDSTNSSEGLKFS